MVDWLFLSLFTLLRFQAAGLHEVKMTRKTNQQAKQPSFECLLASPLLNLWILSSFLAESAARESVMGLRGSVVVNSSMFG